MESVAHEVSQVDDASSSCEEESDASGSSGEEDHENERYTSHRGSASDNLGFRQAVQSTGQEVQIHVDVPSGKELANVTVDVNETAVNVNYDGIRVLRNTASLRNAVSDGRTRLRLSAMEITYDAMKRSIMIRVPLGCDDSDQHTSTSTGCRSRARCSSNTCTCGNTKMLNLSKSWTCLTTSLLS